MMFKAVHDAPNVSRWCCHAGVLTAENVLWSTGASAYAGRFGNPNYFAPVKWNFGISGTITVSDVTCGSAFTLVVTSTGKVYSFGGGNAYVELP